MANQGTERLRGRLWLREFPVTVVVIAAIGGFFASRGFSTYPEGFSSFPYVLDPLYYVVTLFAHSGTSHYLMNMYFLVPAGVILTYLTNNKKVLYVVVVSHIPTVTLCATIGLEIVGAGAAAYGLLAAVLVRTTWFCAEGYSGIVRVGSSIAAVALAGAALVTLVVTAGGSQITYLIPVSGFLLGGTFESCRVLYAFGYEGYDSRIIPDKERFNAPRFRSRWENMAKGDPEEAEKLEERYSNREAAPDDTYAGSRGRSRKD